MTSKDLQEALLNKTPITYDDHLNCIDDVTVTGVVLRNVNGSLAITSVELVEENGKTIYNVLPSYIEKATTQCE